MQRFALFPPVALLVACQPPAKVEPVANRSDAEAQAAADAAAARAALLSPIAVSDGFVRATTDGQTMTAAYVTLTSPVDDALVGVSTGAAASASIHEMKMAGDVMQMRPLARLPLKAGEAAVLKPGGTHLMLEGLKGPLGDGGKLKLVLRFEKAGEQTIELPVRLAQPK